VIVRVATPDHYWWLVERVGYAPTTGLRCLEAMDDSGRIAGMVGFDNWMPNSVEMHFAIAKPMALRRLIKPAFRAAFEAADREYVIGLTPSSRARILSWRARFGFKELHRLKDGFAVGDDLVYSALHRDDCPFLKERELSNGLPELSA
jgi:hypothetical protein